MKLFNIYSSLINVYTNIEYHMKTKKLINLGIRKRKKVLADGVSSFIGGNYVADLHDLLVDVFY